MPGEIIFTRETCPVETLICEVKEQEIVDIAIDLPVMAEYIFDFEQNVSGLGIELLDSSAVVHGEIVSQISYLDEENHFESKNERVSFQSIIYIPGACPGNIPRVKGRVAETETRFSEEGMRLNQKVVIDLSVKVVERKELEFITSIEADAPADLKIKKLPLNWEVLSGEAGFQECISERFTLLREAKKILCNRVIIRDLRTEVKEGRVLVGGILDNYLFFMDSSDCLAHHVRNIPYILDLEVTGALEGQKASLDLFASVDSLSFDEETGKEAEINIVLEGHLELTAAYERELISSVSGSNLNVKLEEIRLSNIKGRASIQKKIESISTLEGKTDRVYFAASRITHLTPGFKEGIISAEGMLSCMIFYRGDEMRLGVQRDRVPFVAEAEVPASGLENGARLEGASLKSIFRLLNEETVEHIIEANLSLALLEELNLKVVKDIELLEEVITDREVAGKNINKLYIVQNGDTFFKIANRFRMNMEEILAANPEVEDPEAIMPGQKINIPKTIAG